MLWLQNAFGNLNLIDLSCLVAWVILLMPALVYLATTWGYRRELLFDRLSPEAIRLYYQQFVPSSGPKRRNHASKRVREDDMTTQFRRDFGRLYGKRHYVLPLLLLALIAGLGLRATAQSIQGWLGWTPNIKSFSPIAISAFLGGYAWVLYDQFRRYRTGDFTVHDVYNAIYRFLIAVPLGISMGSLLKDNAGVGVAFLLAAFPTSSLIDLSKRLASQKLGLGENEKGGPLELEKLQWVGRSNAERYVDEGFTTITELAWGDPIALTIKTNREFIFVLDSVSQALLWVYFEDRVRLLYPLGLRGAQDVSTLFQDLDSEDHTIKRAAEKNLKAAAALLDLEEETFKYTLLSVKEDPYAKFIFNVWQ